jgi:DNA-binding transcriptional ArsR family regulator
MYPAEIRGDTDIAKVAALFAEPARARVLLALTDGRALPATVLAAEAGLSPSATSAHLGRLRAAGLIEVERSGRHRYHRLAGEHVATVIEALASIAPAQPVRSLKQGSRAAALLQARTCYDHLAGRLGVRVTSALLDRGALVATDGTPDNRRRPDDPLSSRLRNHPYQLGPTAGDTFSSLGVDIDALHNTSGRPLLRFCVDWSEQRHHLSGRLGAALLTALFDAGWLVRMPARRAVKLTDLGARELGHRLGLAELTAA